MSHIVTQWVTTSVSVCTMSHIVTQWVTTSVSACSQQDMNRSNLLIPIICPFHSTSSYRPSDASVACGCWGPAVCSRVPFANLYWRWPVQRLGLLLMERTAMAITVDQYWLWLAASANQYLPRLYNSIKGWVRILNFTLSSDAYIICIVASILNMLNM